MTTPLTWDDANRAHLSAGLRWLRLRLAQAAEGAERHEGTARTRRWWGRRAGTGAATSIVDQEVTAAREALRAAEASAPPPALCLLARACGLSEFERQLLLLCAALELDTGFGQLCARAQGDAAKPYPTFALALACLEEASWAALAPERPLRALRLIEINQSGNQPLIAAPLRIDERIAAFLKGLNYLDERIAGLSAPLHELSIAGVDPGLPPSQRALVDRLEASVRAGRGFIHMHGGSRAERLAVANELSRRLGTSPQWLAADALPARGSDLDAFIQLWRRETLLVPLLLVVELGDGEPAAQEHTCGRVQRLAARVAAPVVVMTPETLAGLPAHVVDGEVPRSTAREQRAAWEQALVPLGEARGDVAERLAGQFNLPLPVIATTAAQALERTTARAGDLETTVWEACAIRPRPALDQLAQRIDPRATWDALVLPAHEKEQLARIVQQVRERWRVYDRFGFRDRMSRGLGITALFVGESGTGKTLAAEVLAHELRLALYRVDLSSVVNKYIGETEKNLRRVFDAAEDGGAILFFDEADALFGKRSEVRDSHDRYANIEINYLLQRMESFSGLAILATNMKQALDTAFMRRLRFVVTFPFPGATERGAIWANAFPADTPVDGLDWDQLARLGLSGGSIQNVALNAAFLAAGAGTAVDMGVVMDAVRMELRKLERSTSPAQMRTPRANGARA